MTAPSVDEVIKRLLQLRATLVCALQQPRISAAKFNDCRAQILPLDEQLRRLGVTDLKMVPQMQPSFVRMTRHQRRMRQRGDKFNTYENRLKRKFAERAHDDDA